MSKWKGALGSVAAIMYFVYFMLITILLLILYPLFFLTEVSSIRNTGFAGPNISISFVGICGLFIGLSMLIRPLRKMYYALPWLYPFVKIFFINLVILCVGVSILNYGYQTVNEARHALFFVLMIIQIIVSRISMCFYFKKRPAKFLEEKW